MDKKRPAPAPFPRVGGVPPKDFHRCGRKIGHNDEEDCLPFRLYRGGLGVYNRSERAERGGFSPPGMARYSLWEGGGGVLTYSFENIDTESMYEHLYRCIKQDILQKKLRAGEKLPSKRSFAKNLGVSTITVESA